jgi:single-strand DNA-binding protein
MNLNRVQLADRLTRDPEIRYTQGGVAVADFSLAVSRFWKNDKGKSQEETDFIDATAFGRTAEVIQKHLGKGRAVYVEGRLKLDQWEKDGQKRSKLKVVADSMQFVGPKPQAETSEPSPSPALVEQRARNAATTASKPAPAKQAATTVPVEDPTDDVPF